MTNELSQALQKRDHDIVNAMKLVQLSKRQLQDMRSNGWDKFLDVVSSFAIKHDIDIPNMDEKFVPQGRSRRNAQEFTNLHHYRVDMFYTVIDMQLQELNNRFNEANTELLLSAACFNPRDGFSTFHTKKLVRLTEFYPEDFSAVELMILQNQVETYILDMRSDDEFLSVKGIIGLAEKLVERKKDGIYSLVYRLLKLTLTLPIVTANVERTFLAMNIVKSKLRNKMGDEWLNDCLLTYIESELFEQTDKDVIAERFQK